MNDFKNSVKGVMSVFLILFVGLISYIAYSQTFIASDIANNSANKRLWAKRNEVLRGTIYDRNGNPLTSSVKTGDLTQSRTYLQNDLYVHALGYVSTKYDLTGLEKSYDEELSTYTSKMESGIRSLITNFSIDSLKHAFDSRDTEKQQKIGNGVITTLNPDVQRAAYDALGNRRGAVVALDPSNGQVLAMVSKPTYNPNDLDAAMATANAGTAENSPLINRATSGLYAPGSTFKTVTLASALSNISGVKNRTFEDNGSLQLSAKQSLSNDSGEVNGSMDLEKSYIRSSNVVFGTLALELGNSKLKETAEKFGFNNNIPTNGFYLNKSSFPTLGANDKGLIAQTGIGQASILATPMQMALVCGTVANNGVMMEPTLVKEIVDKDKNVIKKVEPNKYSQVMSSSDATMAKTAMRGVVEDHLVSIFSGIEAAGKTGTAETTDSNGNLTKSHSWFIGFAPANKPKVAVAVIVENAGYGKEAAAPVTAAVMRAALNSSSK
ncbi:MAG: penicillin-binding protein 2 [Clostridium sp.]|nr:penicillin-binding protein 2 [Clostridium sp.]